jgi:hypothetical protein
MAHPVFRAVTKSVRSLIVVFAAIRSLTQEDLHSIDFRDGHRFNDLEYDMIIESHQIALSLFVESSVRYRCKVPHFPSHSVSFIVW